MSNSCDSGDDADDTVKCEECWEEYPIDDQLSKCDTCEHHRQECNLCPHCAVRLSLFETGDDCFDAIVSDITGGLLYYCLHPEHGVTRETTGWFTCCHDDHDQDHRGWVIIDPDVLLLILAVQNPVLKSVGDDPVRCWMDLDKRIARLNSI
jgi:hypothetical protein